MNLCGGVVNAVEPDQLLLDISDEQFQLTPRRKAASSLPSRHWKGVPGPVDTERRTPTERKSFSRPLSARSRSRASQSPIATASPTFLNPLSKDDLKKSMNRQRPAGPPLHTSKNVAGPIKKLAVGYHVVSATDLLC